MKKIKAPTERNPYIQHIRLKPSGAHNKSKKAQRQKDKINLKKEAFA